MTTSLKLIALALAASLPSAFAADLSGLTLPAAMDPLHLFAALVAALVLLTAFADYGRRGTLRILAQQAALAHPERTAAHPLAA